METKKKKIVAKVIAKNVLVWICTLCLILCFIPLRSQAEEEGKVSCTVTLKLDNAAWSDQNVVLKKVSNEGETVDLTGTEGSYSGQMEKDVPYNLYVNDVKRADNLSSSEEAVTKELSYHTVAFLDDNGQALEPVVPSQIVLSGVDTLTNPGEQTKEGYTFKAWVTEQGGSEAFVFETPVSSDTTAVYASWTKDDEDEEEEDEEDPSGHEHTMSGSEDLKFDEFGHWQYCTGEECTVDDWDSSENLPEEIKEEYFEAHDLKLEEEDAPTCDTVGKGKYTCSVCDYEVEGEVEIPTRHTPPSKDQEDAFTTDEHSHTYECTVCEELVTEDHAWFKDQEGDSFTCQVCGAEHTEHDYEDVITKAPTFRIEGEKYSRCRICGDTTEPETIPTIDEHKVSWGASDTNTGLAPSIQTNGADLVEYLLTDEEKARVANEKLEVQFILEVSEETVTPLDKVLIEGYMAINPKLNGYHVLKYVDINLFKKIGGDPREEIHEVAEGKMVSISVELPDEVQKAGRSYAVIRVHDGQPDLIETPETKGTLMVNTNKFSTYAIVYNGAAIDGTGDGNNGSGNGGNGSNTGNNGNGQNNGNNNNNTGNSGNNGASGSTSDTNNGNTGNQNNGTNAGDSDNSSNNNSSTSNTSPKTADTSPIVLYMTIAMISAMAYLFLFVTDKERRMTEQDKDALINALVMWARKHGATAKFFMAFAVFCILLYYHTVGKRVKGLAQEQV